MSGTPSGTNQLVSNATLTVLGNNLPALQSYVNPPMTIGGTTYNEVYSFGYRVFDQSAYFHDDAGIFGFTAGLAPTEIRVPLVNYPVGPLILQIAAGARFDANIQARMTPEIFVSDPSLSVLGVNLTANVNGAGFIEGDASLIAIRAGIGGQLDLLDAQATVQSQFFFNGASPQASIAAYAEFLSGKIYLFADFFDILVVGWQRLWENDLYTAKGTCFTAGGSVCPAP